MADEKKSFLEINNEDLVIDPKTGEKVINTRKVLSKNYETVNEPKLIILEKALDKSRADKNIGRTAPATLKLYDQVEGLTNSFVIVVGDNLEKIPADLVAMIISNHEVATSKLVIDDSEKMKLLIAEQKSITKEQRAERVTLYNATMAYRDALNDDDLNSKIEEYKKSISVIKDDDNWNVLSEFMNSDQYPLGKMNFREIAKFIHESIGRKLTTINRKAKFTYEVNGFETLSQRKNVDKIEAVLKALNPPKFDIKKGDKYALWQNKQLKTSGYSTSGLIVKIRTEFANFPEVKMINIDTKEITII